MRGSDRSLQLAMALVSLVIACADQASEAEGDSAWSAFARGDLQTAQANWQAQLSNAQERSSTEDAAVALCNIALVHERRGSLDEAEQTLKLCMQQAEPRGQTWMIAAQRLAKLYERKGEVDRAEAVLSTAANSFEGDAPLDLAMRSSLMSKLGSLHRRSADLDRSEDLYRQAADLAKAAHDVSGEATAWNDLAWVYADQGKDEDAKAACRRWLELVIRQDPSQAEQARAECDKIDPTH